MAIGNEYGRLDGRNPFRGWTGRFPSPFWLMGVFALGIGIWLLYPLLFSSAPSTDVTTKAPMTAADRAQPFRPPVASAATVSPALEHQAKPAEPPSLSGAPEQAQPRSEMTPDDGRPVSQPVAHARNASVRACLPALQELSQMVVDGKHIAFSTWNNAAANDRLFQSIVGLKYDNKNAPVGLSVLIAAPMQSEKCDGATVQIQPSVLPCDRIAKTLTGAQLPAADLNGIRMIEATKSTRVVLLPTRGNGCAVVGIGVHYAK